MLFGRIAASLAVLVMPTMVLAAPYAAVRDVEIPPTLEAFKPFSGRAELVARNNTEVEIPEGERFSFKRDTDYYINQLVQIKLKTVTETHYKTVTKTRTHTSVVNKHSTKTVVKTEEVVRTSTNVVVVTDYKTTTLTSTDGLPAYKTVTVTEHDTVPQVTVTKTITERNTPTVSSTSVNLQTSVTPETTSSSSTSSAPMPTSGNNFITVPMDVPIYNLNGWQYGIDIFIGGQNFSLIFDTGSGDIWVGGPDCNSEFCATHKQFDTSASTTFKYVPGMNYQLGYVSGSFEAAVGDDTIALGPVSRTDTWFGLATNVSSNFNDLPAEGILGFSFGSAYDQKSFFTDIFESGLVPEDVFSLYLDHESGSDTSRLTLGGVNDQYFDGNFTYVSLVVDNSWIISSQELKIGDTVLYSETTRTYVDSGTTSIILPQAIYDTLGSTINMGTVQCSELPNLSITFGETTFELEPKQYSYYSGIWCKANVYAWNSNDIILGAPFLQNFYTTFDMSNSRIGFAPLKEEYTSWASS